MRDLYIGNTACIGKAPGLKVKSHISLPGDEWIGWSGITITASHSNPDLRI